LKTKTSKQTSVNVVTLGCSKNLVDSEEIMGQLIANNFDVKHESQAKKQSEVVIINTCGFIDNAKQESIDTILHYARKKEKGQIEKLIVTGCLSERYKPDLEKEITNVDAYFGTRDLQHLLKTLGANYKHELVGERMVTTPKHFAYLKISEGCDRPCSFCAIPLMRGGHVSKPIQQIVDEAKKLAAKGTKELLLIAQDSTYYGLDLYKERKLASLMEALAMVDGIEWIRLHYAFPMGFPMDVIDVMANHDNICKYLDIPLQHVNDEILKSMRRGTTQEKTLHLLQNIRNKIPNITLRTTLISGYPGETDAHHNDLIQFINDVRFDRLGVFAYSHEEDTHAHKLVDNVSDETKQQRVAEIMNAQQEISWQLNQNKIGNTYKVIVDRKEGNFYIGRTEADSPEVDNEVIIDTQNNYLRIGSFVNVTINKAEEFDLYGTINNQ
jgi:ribosomal protein S12 methylthiotransferase